MYLALQTIDWLLKAHLHSVGLRCTRHTVHSLHCTFSSNDVEYCRRSWNHFASAAISLRTLLLTRPFIRPQSVSALPFNLTASGNFLCPDVLLYCRVTAVYRFDAHEVPFLVWRVPKTFYYLSLCTLLCLQEEFWRSKLTSCPFFLAFCLVSHSNDMHAFYFWLKEERKTSDVFYTTMEGLAKSHQREESLIKKVQMKA